MLPLFVSLLFSINFLWCSGEEPSPQQVPNSVNNICNCNCNLPKRSFEELCNLNETLLGSVVSKENKKLERELKVWISQLPSRDETFDFLFTNKGISDYVMIHDLSRDLSSFTISLWMRSYDRTTSSSATIFSYATPSGADNTILLINTENLKFLIHGEERDTSIKLNDGKWHHVAFTWKNSDGAWKGFKDGINVVSGSGLKNGKVISKTGTLVLGQDQDTVGGNFQDVQSYIGLLSQVNLWDRVLTQQEIKSLSNSCHTGSNGNILKWDGHWLAGVRGNTRIVRPSSCKA